MSAPSPLVPLEVDLRNFVFMPLDVLRLRDSDLMALATGDEFKAAVALWCVAWHQVPAASLPKDDRLLARYSGAGPTWQTVKVEALRGFVECSDGRLYHSVIAEKALEAWASKQAQRARTAAATAAREQRRRDAQGQQPAQRDVERDDQRDDQRDVARNVVQGTGTGTGTGKGQGDSVVGAAVPPPAAGAAATPSGSERSTSHRGTRLPPNWTLPKAWGDWALAEYSQWTEAKVRLEAEKFSDFWHAKAGKDATKVDWLAAWRNWCRSDLAHRDDPKPNGRTSAAGAQPPLDELTAGVQRRLGITPSVPSMAQEVIDG